MRGAPWSAPYHSNLSEVYGVLNAVFYPMEYGPMGATSLYLMIIGQVIADLALPSARPYHTNKSPLFIVLNQATLFIVLL